MESTVASLHRQAMYFANLAQGAREQSMLEVAKGFARSAFCYERKALRLFERLVDPKVDSVEPSRSILCRSAASLAYQAGDYKSAHKLIVRGLKGSPPAWVREELETLAGQVSAVEA